MGSEKQLASPYYGVGNASAYDEDLVTAQNPYYYRYGRTRRSIAANLQRPVGSSPLRFLVGVGVNYGSIERVPYGEGITLLGQELGEAGATADEGWVNYARVGLVYDTRDRETAPRRGTWSEFLIQRFDKALGSSESFTRWTATDRRYVSAGPVTLANRFFVQGTAEGVPLFELHRIQTSFKQQEGLGGAQSIRGVRKNRIVGRGMMLWNAEVRLRALDFGIAGKPFHLVLSAFADAGRVWVEGPQLDELLSDLHRGYGGGLRIGMGENFMVACDAGTSAETGMQLYIGLGYLY